MLIFFRAENEVRTRDPQLGKLMLYQLSYFRLGISGAKVMRIFDFAKYFFISHFRKLYRDEK